MPDRLTILLTNIWLGDRAGSETVIRDLALGLVRRGHRPIVYAPVLGEVAEELIAKGIVVIDDLRRVGEPPDILHAHHLIPCGEALIRFPYMPAIYTCHAFAHWMEAPAHFPQVAAYLAVDEACRDRLVHAEGIDPARVILVPNAVDLARIPPRSRPLMEQPGRAIAFGKAVAVLQLRVACEQLGIAFEAIGYGDGRPSAYPERELVNADLVFASARCALEGLCCGCAVVVCDQRGIAGLVTSDNYETLRGRNFGLRSLGDSITIERLVQEIQCYDPVDAARVSERARRDAGLEKRLGELEQLYAEVLEGTRRPNITQEAHERAVARFHHEYLPRHPGDSRWPWLIQREELLTHIQQLEARLSENSALIEEIQQRARAAEERGARTQQQALAAEERAARTQQQLEETQSDFSILSMQLADLRQSRMLKLGRVLRRILGRPTAY